MRILVVAVGRMKAGPERQLVARYLDRAIAAGKPLGLSGFEVHESAESRASAPARRKAEEAGALRQGMPEGAVRVALDEHGKSLDSPAFGRRLAEWRDAGRPGAAFVIGGADGLDPGLVAEAELVLSFSPLTWPHQLVRIMLSEQLYRATTILSGHPYHRE
jgi:23S rRNA (pseudouridine1915-N3)-methyltransferase